MCAFWHHGPLIGSKSLSTAPVSDVSENWSIPRGIKDHGREGAVALSEPPGPPGAGGTSTAAAPGPNGPAKPGRRSNARRGPIGGIP